MATYPWADSSFESPGYGDEYWADGNIPPGYTPPDGSTEAGHISATNSPFTVVVYAQDSWFSIDLSGGNVTINLPTYADGIYSTLRFEVINASGANEATIYPNGAETIDGAASVVLSALGSKLEIYSDGAAWIPIS
jgi:hypothetical protein